MSYNLVGLVGNREGVWELEFNNNAVIGDFRFIAITLLLKSVVPPISSNLDTVMCESYSKNRQKALFSGEKRAVGEEGSSFLNE